MNSHSDFIFSQLWLARIHADELREAWKTANATRERPAAGPGRASRARAASGRLLIRLGRLVSGDPAMLMERPARRTQPGC